MKTLVALTFLALIAWQLGAGLLALLTDTRGEGRVVRALTRRIVLSLVLFALIVLGIATGVVVPNAGPG